MKTWQIFSSLASELLLLLNTLFFFAFFWKASRALKMFTGLLLFSLCIEITTHVMWFQHHFYGVKVNNLYLLHFYTLVEFLILTLFYHQIFKNISIWQKNIFWLTGLISLLIVANSIFLQPITVFNTNAKTLTQVIYIAYAVGFFLNATHHQTESYHNVLKTINSAILLYYTGSLFIFMFSNVLLGLEQRHNLFWVANALLYLIFQLLVFTAIWQFRQTKSTYS